MKRNRLEVFIICVFLIVLLGWGIFVFKLMGYGIELLFNTVFYETKIVTTKNTTELARVKPLKVTYYDEPYKITVYTPFSDNGKCGYLTATGVKSKHLTTCAVDTSVIPLGSTVIVNGLKLKAVDTGSMVKGNVIDIFFDGSNEEAKKWLSDFGTSHSVKRSNYE